MNRNFITTAAAVAVLALSACGGGDPLTADDPPEDANGGNGGGSITVGSANFPENVLLAEIYAGALRGAGLEVETQLNIGSRETYIPALQDGSIDLIPEYTGNLLSYLADGETEATDSEAVYDALTEALPEGLVVLEQSEAQDKDAVVVTRDTAEEYDLTSIADLEPVAGELVLGGPPEWRDRFSGVPGLQEVYGLEFAEFRPLDVAGPLTVAALQDGTVDAANLFTTQSAISANDFVVLEDPEELFLAQNVVPLGQDSALTDEGRDALNAVSAALDTELLTDLVARVEVDQEDPSAVAEDFLSENGLI